MSKGGGAAPPKSGKLVPSVSASTHVVGQRGPVDGQESVSSFRIPTELLRIILEFVMDQDYDRQSIVGQGGTLMFRQASRLARVSKQFQQALKGATVKQLSLPRVESSEDLQRVMNSALKLFKNVAHLNLRVIQMTEGNPELLGLQSLIARNMGLSKLTLWEPTGFDRVLDPTRQSQLLDRVGDIFEQRNSLNLLVQKKFKKIDLYMRYAVDDQARHNRLLRFLPYLETLTMTNDKFVNAETIAILSEKRNLYHWDVVLTSPTNFRILQTTQPTWLSTAIMMAIDKDIPDDPGMVEFMMQDYDATTKVLMEGNHMTKLLNPRTNFVIRSETLLERVINNRKINLAEALLKNGADPFFTLDQHNNILQWVMFEVFEDEMKRDEPTAEPFLMLLLKSGADINAKDRFGSPYFWRVGNYIDEIDVVKWLKIFIEYGADLNLRNYGGETLLEYIFLDEPLIKSFELFDFLLQNTNLDTIPFLFDVEGLGTLAEKTIKYLESQLSAEKYAEETKDDEDALPFEAYRAKILQRLASLQ